MRIKFSYILVFLITAFILLIFFKSLFEDKSYVPKKINNKIENISIEEFYSGNNLMLRELINDEKYIIINIWASWCIPCRQEHQYLKNISKITDFKMIGLNYKDKKENAEKFLEELGNPYDVILRDQNGTKSIFFGAFGVPETFIIDSELNIVRKYIGPLNLENQVEIEKLLK